MLKPKIKQKQQYREIDELEIIAGDFIKTR